MKYKLIIAALLLFVGGVIGWSLNRPSPLPTIEIEAAKVRVAKADTVFIRDTIRYREWKTVYDTVREQLDITDTVEVVRYVKVADSTIAACNLALQSCTKALALRDTVIVYQDRYIKEKPTQSRWKVWGERAIWFSVGYGASKMSNIRE